MTSRTMHFLKRTRVRKLDERWSNWRKSGVVGAIHGVAELLPVSSSAHVWPLAQRCGYQPEQFPPAKRKAFEVALHAGTLIPVAGRLRCCFKKQRNKHGRTLLPALFLSALPAVVVGGLTGKRIEKHFHSQRSTAFFLAFGSAFFVAGDRQCMFVSQQKTSAVLDTNDLLYCGFAQVFALIPGFSRLGMVFAVLRLRGYAREDAYELAHLIGLPVGCAALMYKATDFFCDSNKHRSAKSLPPSSLVGASASALAAQLFFPHMKGLLARYPDAIIGYRLLFALHQLYASSASKSAEL